MFMTGDKPSKDFSATLSERAPIIFRPPIFNKEVLSLAVRQGDFPSKHYAELLCLHTTIEGIATDLPLHFETKRRTTRARLKVEAMRDAMGALLAGSISEGARAAISMVENYCNDLLTAIDSYLAARDRKYKSSNSAG